ncbi:hypothetical protein [Hydrogenophaga sp. PBL-H3]|uniref:hypothetical protein n=1 Tax=Hydrogenophaga sp. PBL-H3 TaxID=434010 RepID=UPI0013203281|nr:hypothetical protein [Hydrogenophaga sp. PBL-H3]QHE77321.1 hypothetical protein F9Z45_15390 [Hydrogenophaga sp. PBL-H3]QHE81745.1 hypothetical protein F9Z44_15390 [Hydrogenophaga sp. PBL-H3]
MPFIPRALFKPAAVAALCLLIGAPALAGEGGLCPGFDQPASAEPDAPRYEAFFSPYTHHWTPNDEHEQVYALSVSRLLPNNRYCGFSLFNNSFGQPSAYAFIGKSWPGFWQAQPALYASLSAGVIYGYVGKYKNKVPLNVGGFSPVVIPAIGYRLSPKSSLEIQLLGTAAVMFGTTWRF